MGGGRTLVEEKVVEQFLSLNNGVNVIVVLEGIFPLLYDSFSFTLFLFLSLSSSHDVTYSYDIFPSRRVFFPFFHVPSKVDFGSYVN